MFRLDLKDCCTCVPPRGVGARSLGPEARPKARRSGGQGVRGARGPAVQGSGARGPGARGPGARGQGARGQGARGQGARGQGSQGARRQGAGYDFWAAANECA